MCLRAPFASFCQYTLYRIAIQYIGNAGLSLFCRVSRTPRKKDSLSLSLSQMLLLNLTNPSILLTALLLTSKSDPSSTMNLWWLFIPYIQTKQSESTIKKITLFFYILLWLWSRSSCDGSELNLIQYNIHNVPKHLPILMNYPLSLPTPTYRVYRVIGVIKGFQDFPINNPNPPLTLLWIWIVSTW